MGQNISKVNLSSTRTETLKGRALYRHTPGHSDEFNTNTSDVSRDHDGVARSFRMCREGQAVEWQVVGPSQKARTSLRRRTRAVTRSQTSKDEEFFDALYLQFSDDEPEDESLPDQIGTSPANVSFPAPTQQTRRVTRSQTKSMRNSQRHSRPLPSALRQTTSKSVIRKRLRHRTVPGVHFAATCTRQSFDQEAAPMPTKTRRSRKQEVDATGKDTRPSERRTRGNIEIRFQREGIDGLRREFLPDIAVPVRCVRYLEQLTDQVISVHGEQFEYCTKRPDWIRFRITEQDPDDTNELCDSKEFTKLFELKKWIRFETRDGWQWGHLCIEYQRFLTAWRMARDSDLEEMVTKQCSKKKRDWLAVLLCRDESGDEIRRRLRSWGPQPVVELLWTDREM